MRSRSSQPPRGRANEAPDSAATRGGNAPGLSTSTHPGWGSGDVVPATGGRHVAAGVRPADRRGLTATGAVLCALALGLAGAGAGVDLSTGRGLRLVFGVCFVAGCALAALLVHREDLKAVVVMPPLLHAAIAVLTSALGRTARSSSGLKGHALEAVVTLVLGAPILIAATGVAVLIALARTLVARRRRTS